MKLLHGVPGPPKHTPPSPAPKEKCQPTVLVKRRESSTNAHPATMTESRGGEGLVKKSGQQQILGKHRQSVGLGLEEAGPRGRAPPSGVARQSSTPIPILTQDVAARRPHQRGPGAGVTRAEPRSGLGQAAGGGRERERRGRGQRAWGGNCAQILRWLLPTPADLDPWLSPSIPRSLVPCSPALGGSTNSRCVGTAGRALDPWF